MTVSLLVHYFTLVAVMWMGAEALFMFQKLVLVFIEITTKYIIIVSIICWGNTFLIIFVCIRSGSAILLWNYVIVLISTQDFP